MLEAKPDPMMERDLVGYGEHPPDPQWPGGASIAVNFNLNVEGGGEATLANGDETSEGVLNDIGASPLTNIRVPLVNRYLNMAAAAVSGAYLISFAISPCTLAFLPSRGRSSKIPGWRVPSSSVATRL